MKLVILCNFGPYSSVGGSEAVISAIAERLICPPYNYEIDIYAHNYKKDSIHKGINLFPCPKGDNIVPIIAQNEHIMVYSDSQWNFDSLLGSIGKTAQKASICLVGAYHLQSHPQSLQLLKENISRFNLITHSQITCDYKFCIDNDLPVKVVPNGVNLSEFEKSEIDFRQKYNIKEKYMILNVGNFFYGKGFELIPKIAQKLSEDLDDFVIVQCSNTIRYPYDKIFFERTKKQSKGLNVRFLRDLPRVDIVAAFKESDMFLFPSKKEIAPIVILECRAAKLPYISMKVGNMMENPGGVPVNYQKVDNKGYVLIEDSIIRHFSAGIFNSLIPMKINGKKNTRAFKNILISDGQEDIESIDWDQIVPLYDEVFKG